MKKLNKTHLKQRDDISAQLTTAKDELEKAIDEYNEGKDKLWEEVREKLEAFNAVLTDAREWRDEIVQEIEDYTSERSEKWQESDAAQTIESWKSEFEYAELDDAEIDEPEDIEMPDVSDEVLTDLPEEAE